MTGWSYKEITSDDLKFPVVYGEGKRSRLLATIGQLSIFSKQNVLNNGACLGSAPRVHSQRFFVIRFV